MNSFISKRISSLRDLMKDKNIQACIIPSSDPHISEYPADHWKSREWFSGFNGSAGTLVVTMKKAGLWTDSRYFLQAEDQLKDTGIKLFKDRMPGTISIESWLSDELEKGSIIGIDGKVFSISEVNNYIKSFLSKEINIDINFDASAYLWNDRPPIPSGKTFILPEFFSGSSPREKISKVIEEMNKTGVDLTIIGALDTIAWLFNIRGNDVLYNPVVICYAIISKDEAILFIDPEKLTIETTDYLRQEGILIAEYEKIASYIQKVSNNKSILINPSKLNYYLYNSIASSSKIVETDVHPADFLKSIKNETEIKGIHQSMIKDGIAMVRFLIWLEHSIKSGNSVTELEISNKLHEFRSQQDYYFSESFETISAYGSHGAIIHYSADNKSNSTVNPEGFLLLDSGAQYFDGTTDITRTIVVGKLSEKMQKDYTLVLKGNIALDRAKFPKGTKGIQLDILARLPLWEEGINYFYGTGHGVGHFLNVHEGPQSIRMDYNPVTLEKNMIISNEPGIYRTNEYGIRIENLLRVIEDQTTEYGEYYGFETLTLCPIDKEAINIQILSQNEIEWLDNYHEKVRNKLSPFLSEEEKNWLKNKTNKLYTYEK